MVQFSTAAIIIKYYNRTAARRVRYHQSAAAAHFIFNHDYANHDNTITRDGQRGQPVFRLTVIFRVQLLDRFGVKIFDFKTGGRSEVLRGSRQNMFYSPFFFIVNS